MTPLDREAILRGVVARCPASDESRRLVAIAMEHASAAFASDDLQRVHERAGGDELWQGTCTARAALASDPRARAACVELAVALGFRRATLAFDVPRLRVVSPNAHLRPAAARAYYMHRDTWYGSPASQINVWVPLFDVDERDSFAIWTDAFGAPVENDSSAFDYARFVTHGGFQSAAVIDAAYPRALESPRGARTCVRASAAEIVAFSAAHLHATTPNETQRTRFSVDVRFVDLDDHERRLAAPDADNASRGSALVDYLRGDA